MSMDSLSSVSIPQIVGKAVDTVSNCALLFMETAAQLSIGQTIFRFVDRCLWIIEKSVQWSLPAQEITEEENGKTFGKPELVRPLPWIFFLMALIFLRLFRFGINIGAMVLGYPRIEPAGMVKFLQKARRKLRSIKSNAMKNMRQRRSCPKDREPNANHAKWRSAEFLRTIQTTLSSLSCLDGSKLSPSPPPTRIKVHMNQQTAPTPEEKSTTESVISRTHEDSKRKYSELSSGDSVSEESEEETIQAKIDRLAAGNDSMDDDEYSPAEKSGPEDDSESISGESSVSVSELRDIQDEAKLILNRACQAMRVAEIITEEPEPIKRMSDNERTGEDEKFVYSRDGYTSGNRDDFYSPCKLGEDSETAFYSPISSTSPSPDRMVPIFKRGQQDCPIENETEVPSPCENGEQNADTEPKISASNDKTTNGHTDEKSNAPTNVSTKNVKSHHRGKRANHSSRKKK